jgi:hypothetical protein
VLLKFALTFSSSTLECYGFQNKTALFGLEIRGLQVLFPMIFVLFDASA